jgi:hypothetical protein
MLRRLLLAVFCVAVYWWKIHNGMNGDLFFWLGIGIIGISMILMFVLHIKISVFRNHDSGGSIILDGLWTTRKVKIDLGRIVKVERKRYSKYKLNNPVFNLHLKGKIRFYTGGRDAIEITDSDGLPYRIGTQRPVEFERVLKELTHQTT